MTHAVAEYLLTVLAIGAAEGLGFVEEPIAIWVSILFAPAVFTPLPAPFPLVYAGIFGAYKLGKVVGRRIRR